MHTPIPNEWVSVIHWLAFDGSSIHQSRTRVQFFNHANWCSVRSCTAGNSNRPQSPLPHTLEPRVDEYIFAFFSCFFFFFFFFKLLLISSLCKLAWHVNFLLLNVLGLILPWGVLRFELDRGVPLRPQNPYPSLRVILAEKGTHF